MGPPLFAVPFDSSTFWRLQIRSCLAIKGCLQGKDHCCQSEIAATNLYDPSLRRAKFSGLQKGPAERGHDKNRQNSSKSVKKFFDTFRHFSTISRRAKNVKNRQKVSKSFSTLFDNFRAEPFFRPLLQSADKSGAQKAW